MLEKAIRKAVLSILLASLMVGAGCRITYAEEQQQTTESKVATDDTFVQAPSALLMEAGTGTVIYEKDPDTRRSPASITKIMTLILIFDALENGTLKMDDLVTTSAYAKSMGGSQVFLEEGETQDVETMIKCIVIASGNDASVAMAEHIGIKKVGIDLGLKSFQFTLSLQFLFVDILCHQIFNLMGHHIE